MERPVYRLTRLAALLLISASGPATAAEPRWYTPQMVAAGKPFYQRHCSVCHGRAAEGNAAWRRPGPDGRYLPPPLDGSGHAWHHPRPLLGRIIVHGGVDGTGNMPAWGAVLDDGEVDAILAWLQSRWPERVYNAWRDIDARAAGR